MPKIKLILQALPMAVAQEPDARPVADTAEPSAKELRSLLERIATSTFSGEMTTVAWDVREDPEGHFAFASNWTKKPMGASL